jgi:hypothetical protein
MMTRTQGFRRASLAAGLGLAALVAPAAGLGAAPPGAPVAQVVELWEPDVDPRASALTNALREVIFDGREFALNTRGSQLLRVAVEAKCDVEPFGAELVEASERGMTKACLERVAKRLGTKVFFWGFLFKGEGGKTMVKLHLWQRGEDRSVVLGYEGRDRRRLAERLYRHLVHAGRVGDVRFVVGGGAVAGELFVNGLSQGPFEREAELTVQVGEVAAEVRSGGKVVASGRGVVSAEKLAEVRLEAVVESAPPPPVPAAPVKVAPVGPVAPPPRGPSALPWVFAGVGAVGLAGAGVLFALRQNAKGDLERECSGELCPHDQRDAVDRGNRYGALSLLSLGAGVTGVGVATYLFLNERGTSSSASRGRWVVGSVRPVVGGATVGLSGSF